MNILDTIIAHKRNELPGLKVRVPEEMLRKSVLFNRQCFSLIQKLNDNNSTGIIAEFKRKSPSKGFIHEHANIQEITKRYADGGASGLSVLTDEYFFGGYANDLKDARFNRIPILRKDFIIDQYQVCAAKAMGADVILLIAACLSPNEVEDLSGYAVSLGMEVLLELHDENELGHICKDTIMVGINNRSLKTFEVDINRSLHLSRLIPEGKIKIAESGINDPLLVHRFKKEGYRGFLIGENFMKSKVPGEAFDQFVRSLNI